MKIGCFPVVKSDLGLNGLEFTYSNGCFESMKTGYYGHRFVAYNLHDLNYSVKTLDAVKELVSIYNEYFRSNVVFHKIDEISENSYANYLLMRHQNEMVAYSQGRESKPMNPNQFCYFSIANLGSTINYYNFNILRMLFSIDFSELFENFFKLLNTIDIQPFELLQLCHFCRQDTFGGDKNLLYHLRDNIAKITPIDIFYTRMEGKDKLYDCMDRLKERSLEFVQLFKQGEYMKIYERLK